MHSILSLILLGFISAAAAQSCVPSPMDYDCMQKLSSFANIHWTLEGKLLHIAVEGFGAEWVGFSFAEVPNSMYPADAVIGFVDSKGPNVHPYRVVMHGVTKEDRDPSIHLTNVAAIQDAEKTMISFTRNLAEGTVHVDPTVETLVNYAIGDEDRLKYHGKDRRGQTSIVFAQKS